MFKLARLLVLVTLISVHPTSSDEATLDTFSTDTAADIGQVRLRKLHLVRPDLIPYPISFEVYC